MKESKTYWVRIFIAGDKKKAKDICQKFVDSRGECVNVTSNEYIYTKGSEKGVCVEFINYPRFPRTPNEILCRALILACELREGLSQTSFSVMTPDSTYYIGCKK